MTEEVKRDTILVDIDHVLSDAAWRDDMIGGPGGWGAYHLAGQEDVPLEDMVMVINFLGAINYMEDHVNIVGLTARPEKWRQITVDWLVKNEVRLDDLLMRPADCFLPSPETKLLECERYFEGRTADRVICVMDDREDVCAAFRAIGVTALQVLAASRRKR